MAKVSNKLPPASIVTINATILLLDDSFYGGLRVSIGDKLCKSIGTLGATATADPFDNVVYTQYTTKQECDVRY